ncbi:MAG TPA: metallophosphoesterase family protein [Thermoanaerobaculia bacterium]|nr:metallophosphoesterase family protein [Thermoanaerobaculia bacterium]
MRVALLADVHANLHALEAVLAEARREGYDELWLAGDWVGYGAFPDETVTLLRAAGAIGIIGDMDREVLAAAADALPADAPRQKREALAWAGNELAPGTFAFLAELPEQRRMPLGSLGEALIVHGSPEAIDEHVYPNTPNKRLDELAKVAQAALVVCGHTHQPMDREARGARFLNPGSVGRPGDGDPRAAWALLRVDGEEIAFEPRRVAYDHRAAAESVRDRGLPDAVARMFLEGRKLKEVLGQRG